MAVLTYIAWGLAFFFAGSWTIGIVMYRVKSNIVTVLLWWIEIGLAGLGFYSAVHLFWLMPMSVAIPWQLESIEMRTHVYARIGSIFIKSAIPLGVAIAVLVYLSAPD